MKDLVVSVEINGRFQKAGEIKGDTYRDARFTYSPDYCKVNGIKPLSISLPLSEEAYSAEKTRNFFEGLLPEGFSRKAVAGWAKADQEDYLSILAKLGQECIGAIRIDESENFEEDYAYELLTNQQVKALAAEGATKSTAILMETHLSLTGATGKEGLYYDKNRNSWYLPLGCAASTHIVKQSHVRFNAIVINEQLCLRTAANLGIEVPNSFIINLGDGRDEDIMYASERFDRKLNTNKMIDGLACPFRMHQEDFCQALGIPAAEKYETTPKGHIRKMFDLVRSYSSDPLRDQMRLWDMIVFNYLIGNTDCHLKNYSLLYDESFKGIRLAPAYDIVRTRAYATTNEMSYFIGDELEIDKIGRKHFEQAAKEAGVGTHLAMKHFDKLSGGLSKAAQLAAEELKSYGIPIPEFWKF